MDRTTIRHFIFILFLSIQISAFAQSHDCGCSNIFGKLVESLESNYIGLAFMKEAGKVDTYNELKASYTKKTTQTSIENCSAVLQDFLRNFEDGHLFVTENPTYTEEEIGRFKKKVREQGIDVTRFVPVKHDTSGMVSVWSDGTSKMAIVKKGEYYNAYILESKSTAVSPGELKAQFQKDGDIFKGTYYSYGYAPRYIEGNIYKGGLFLVLTGGIYWGRLDAPDSLEVRAMDKNDFKLPTFISIDDDTTLFTIPSFLTDSNAFIKVLTDNLDLIKNTKTLIFDIRGNIGGNAIYFAFLDAYATNSLQSDQGSVLASEDTKAYFERLAINSPELYGPVVKRIEAAMGKVVDGPAYPERIFKPFESKITNVAILTDEACMSASESFILHSKKVSNKVTTFGSPTGGVIDFTSIHMVGLESCGQNIVFGYPTSTLNKDIPKNGHNQTGLLPDVPIQNSIQNKISFIVDHYKNRK